MITTNLYNIHSFYFLAIELEGFVKIRAVNPLGSVAPSSIARNSELGKWTGSISS